MKRDNPLKHIIDTILTHASYDRARVLARLKLTEEQFTRKIARPSWTFVQDFAKHTDTKVDVRATFGHPSSGTRTVEFKF